MKEILTAAVLVFAAFSTSFADDVIEVVQRGYTTSTLSEPVFDQAKVAVETTMINNWLNENYDRLTDEQLKGPREHLYYLIDSHIKYIYSNGSKILPSEHDLILQILFSWAERLGVYGGALAYNAVKSPNAPEMEPHLNMPSSMSIDLEDDLFVIRSDVHGWRVNVPYYFMTWLMNDFAATNGMPTQLVSLSTGAARDATETGHSQATIMLIFSPSADFEEFTQFWTDGFGIDSKAERLELGAKGLQSLYKFDAASKLHTEVTLWKGGTGLYAVAYLGMDGAYEWNRPHFLDFLNALDGNGVLPPNQSVQSDQPSAGR